MPQWARRRCCVARSEEGLGRPPFPWTFPAASRELPPAAAMRPPPLSARPLHARAMLYYIMSFQNEEFHTRLSEEDFSQIYSRMSKYHTQTLQARRMEIICFSSRRQSPQGRLRAFPFVQKPPAPSGDHSCIPAPSAGNLIFLRGVS